MKTHFKTFYSNKIKITITTYNSYKNKNKIPQLLKADVVLSKQMEFNFENYPEYKSERDKNVCRFFFPTHLQKRKINIKLKQ